MKGPLENIKVVELATMAAVPMAGRLLSEWGAEVIHIEHPVTGDPWRGWLTQSGIEFPPRLEYQFWENYNRNKRSLTLDVNSEAGREILDKLIAEADVFTTNRRPFELEKFHLDYETLSAINKRLIFASITGFGRKGPDKNAPGHDTIGFWARSGFVYQMQQKGTAPPSPGYRSVAAGDKLSGMTLACGILVAILARQTTGVGQEVDVSLLNTGMFSQIPLATQLGGFKDLFETEEAYLDALRRERDEVSPLVISYETGDGRWLQLSLAPSDRFWPQFCGAIERPELEHDPRFDSVESRMEYQADLFEILEAAFLKKTLAEWTDQFDQTELIWSPIKSPEEVIQDPQVLANEYIVPYQHPEFGELQVLANPIQHSQTPAEIRSPAPEMSQHTEEILLELGYSWDQIEQLREDGVIF